jgi:hypothetical protein
MTNVPGPQHALYLAGSHLRRMMFWVPQTGGIGVGISILSYDGGVQFGLVTDKKLCARPQAIIDRFFPEFENLLYAVLLSPWDDEVDPAVAERSLAATESLAQAAGHLAAEEARLAAQEPDEGVAAAGPGAATTPAANEAAAVAAVGAGDAPSARTTRAPKKRSALAARRVAARQ